MPRAITYPVAVVLLTGIAEISGAIGLFLPRTRALAGIMLALYAVCVYPVNINHAVHDLSTGNRLGMGLSLSPPVCATLYLLVGARRRRPAAWTVVSRRLVKAHMSRLPVRR